MEVDELTGAPERQDSLSRKRIFTNTVANGIAQAASIIASFVLLPFLVAAFGLADYGVFMLASSVTNYALLLDLGAGATVTRLVADALERDDAERLRTIIGSAVVFYGAVGAIGAVIMVGMGLAAGHLFAVTPEQAALLRTLLFVGAALQLWYWPATTARHALAGYQRYDLLARVAVGQTLGGVVAVVVVIVAGWGPVALAVLNAIVSVIASIAAIGLLGSAGGVHGRLSAARPTIGEIVRSGLPVFTVQVAALINRQSTDRIVLGIFIGPAAVAIYEIAAKLSQLVTQLSDLVVSAILPVAARLNAREHHDSLRALFVRGAKYTTLIVVPVNVVLVCIAGPFITAWFGPGYGESIQVAQVLVLAQLFVPLYLIGDPILIGKNRYALWVPGSTAMAALNIVLSVILVQRLGIVGVAVGTLVAAYVELPVYARMVLRELKVTVSEWLRIAAWPAYPLLAVPAAIALAATLTALAGSIAGLLMIAAVASGAY